MKLRYYKLIIIGFCLLVSCSKDDDNPDTVLNFYLGADTSVSANELVGIWSIYKIGFKDKIAEAPVNYPDCGRDFFFFSENGVYSEYIVDNSSCEYDVNTVNWKLNKGIITLSNEINVSDDWVIISLKGSEIIFKSQFDVDEDGNLDIITVYAKRYQPKEMDMVTRTFMDNQSEAFDQLLSFTWQAYQGFNKFDRYEIYRSEGNSCSLSNAELVATITDANTTEFTDLDPPEKEYLCYYLKVYTDLGLLGESTARSVWTKAISPNPVALKQPEVVNNTIHFNWLPSNDPYFSHYELAFSNYGGGSGTGQQEYSVATFNNINTTSFIDENPPYLENPYYVLYVHNIFGNRTSFYNSQVTTFWEVDYKREEIINFQNVDSYAIDSNEPIIYFYGKESGSGYTMNIQRFNYDTNQTEAISNLAPQSQTSVPIKFIDSGNGKEIVVEQGSNLSIYNAKTLAYKYKLDTGYDVLGVHDFIYSELGYWIFIDSKNIYTFKRDNANLELIDSKPHFLDHQGNYNYQVFALNENKVLVGHPKENDSFVYLLKPDGFLDQEQIVPIPAINKKTEFNKAGNYLIDFSKNRLYSTTTFSFLESFEAPYFPSGTSINGEDIFGSNNDPKWQVTSQSIHSKKAVIFNRKAKKENIVSTKGYPQVIFENFKGEVVSISSGLKKEDIFQNINNKSDLFIEIVKLP